MIIHSKLAQNDMMRIQLDDQHESQVLAMILYNKRRIYDVSNERDVMIIEVSKRLRLKKWYELEIELFTNNARDIFINERVIDSLDV